MGEDFQSNFNISDTSVSLKVRREGCFASGAEGVIEKSGQLRPLLQVFLNILILSAEGLFPTPTLCSLWIEEISPRYGKHLSCLRSVIKWQNLLILLITNPHTDPYYKSIHGLMLRSWP